MKYAPLLISIVVLSCSDKTPKSEYISTTPEEQPALAVPAEPVVDEPPAESVPIDTFTPLEPEDSELPPVSEVGFTSECDGDENPADFDLYCTCNPQCCEQQQWYCPPRPDNQIHRSRVTVSVCDETYQPCDFGIDEGCPPPQIIRREECELAFECPPNTEINQIQWFDCELADGRFGMQRVVCNKGNLIHGPCRPCRDESCDGEDNDCDDRIDEGRFLCESECGMGWGFCIDQQIIDCDAPSPGEEVCDYEDNDCDSRVDEGQRNECDKCGPVPADNCDGQDNDCDGRIDEELIQECETECGVGFETCNLGNWISCTVPDPTEEVDPCDGLDQDCDGLIDEGLNCDCTVQDVGVLIPCSEPPLVCGQGFKTCVCNDPPECTDLGMSECLAMCAQLETLANQECDRYTGMIVQNEICNNFDEDCDEEVDEGLTVACYTGPDGTLDVGVCVAGNMVCHHGEWGNLRWDRFQRDLCKDEIVPQQEVCDGADNDCDGVTDYGEEIKDTDILFIIDWSGSMDEEIAAVRSALNRFAAHFQAEDKLHWGLVVGPREDDLQRERLYLISDIVSFENFLAAFAGLNAEGMNTSEEMLRDALYFVTRDISSTANFDVGSSSWLSDTASTPDKEDFKINWRENVDKIAIVFTDEHDQSWLNPEITPDIMTTTLAGTTRFKLYTFTPLHNPGNWADWAAESGGRTFELTWNQNQMYENLMSIIDEACLGPSEADQQALLRNNLDYMPASHISPYRYDYENGICL
tara:strand:+ start:33241 stop:35502 length:2262 start_codon:yes stop_codon:yes gene_type:complete